MPFLECSSCFFLLYVLLRRKFSLQTECWTLFFPTFPQNHIPHSSCGTLQHDMLHQERISSWILQYTMFLLFLFTPLSLWHMALAVVEITYGSAQVYLKATTTDPCNSLNWAYFIAASSVWVLLQRSSYVDGPSCQAEEEHSTIISSSYELAAYKCRAGTCLGQNSGFLVYMKVIWPSTMLTEKAHT